MTAPGFDMPDYGPLHKQKAKGEKLPPPEVPTHGIDPEVLAKLKAELDAEEVELGVLTMKGRVKR